MDAAAGIAAAIGEPARARMLYSLMDDRARTGTELAAVAGVTPSTASVHLSRLRAEGLVQVQVQGKHRYYCLAGAEVAAVLTGLDGLAGGKDAKFVPHTPTRLRASRTCYDHMAGTSGVALHDQLRAMGWLLARKEDDTYDLTSKGTKALRELGVDVEGARVARRRFAFACLDWSERRSHLGGALGAAILKLLLKRNWVTGQKNSRALEVTSLGHREMLRRFGARV